MSAAHDSADHRTATLVLDDEASARARVGPWLRERLACLSEHDGLRARLIVAELLDNARRHGLPHYVLELVLDRRAGICTIRFRDRAAERAGGWTAAAGLSIVEALSEQWGYVLLADSTTVWVKVRVEG